MADIPFEMSHYKKGEPIEIRPEDDCLYLVKSGSVQRFVEFPKRNGVEPIRLGKIEVKGYFHPRSAIAAAVQFNMRLQFVCLEETLILKLTDNGLPKKRDELLKVIGILAHVQSKQVAAAEAMIQHEFLRAEQAETERDETLEKVIIAEAEQARLQRELKLMTNERDSALARERVFRGDVKVLRGEVASLKTSMAKGQASMGRAISETERMRAQLSDQAKWIARKFPDSPEVRAGQAVTNADVDAAFDLIGEMFKPLVVPRPSSRAPVPFKPRHSPPPPKPAPKPTKPAPQTDEPFSSETNDDCEVVRDDELWPAGATELIDMGPAHGFQNDEDASETSRQTIPFEPKLSDPEAPAVVVPPHDRLPIVMTAPADTANLPAPVFTPAAAGSKIVQVTKVHDVRSLQKRLAAESEAGTDASHDGEELDIDVSDNAKWRDSYSDDDVWTPDSHRKDK
ncbi:MAG: hypothetical protein WC750_05015 [Patescibacteria group bacterium]